MYMPVFFVCWCQQLLNPEDNISTRCVFLIHVCACGCGCVCVFSFLQVRRLRESGKVVVASVCNVAASGGYYIAMGCETIVCDELSITGSIGVVQAKFAAGEFLDKVSSQPSNAHSFRTPNQGTQKGRPPNFGPYTRDAKKASPEFWAINRGRKKRLPRNFGPQIRGRMKGFPGILDPKPGTEDGRPRIFGPQAGDE